IQPLLYISIVGVNVLTLLLNMAIIPVTIAVLRKGFKPAKFFLIAFLLLVLTVFGFVLTNLGVIQNEFFASYGLLIGSAFEVILLSFAIVDRFKNFKDQALANLEALNKVEREQNVVLEKKVAKRTIELTTKQQEILSSIRYAQRIQTNMLPSENDVRQAFPESFVFYRPKDIISGDFYWIDETDTTIQLAVGDCTGHGVPGAMMSILAINMVKEAHQKIPSGKPNQILELMDVLLAEALRSGEYNYASDGMDIIIIHIDKTNNQLYFSGAQNGLIVLRENEIIELKGTRRPLGLTDQMTKTPFETIEIPLSSGDQLYAFTDGIPDQFGGEQLKKLKQKGLISWFTANSHTSMQAQREAYMQAFESWKNGEEQIDDVCLIGIKYH
ncbi:MAG: PP2C family protein-serine/threonine phosphatase, partial [Flavobacteriales bacterium]